MFNFLRIITPPTFHLSTYHLIWNASNGKIFLCFLQSVIMAGGIRWHFFNYYSVADIFVENVISLLYDTCAFYLDNINFAFVKLRYKSQYRQSNINRHEILNDLHIFSMKEKNLFYCRTYLQITYYLNVYIDTRSIRQVTNNTLYIDSISWGK